jgi:hypothetical protein
LLDAVGRFCHKKWVIVCGREISAEYLECLRAEGPQGSRRQRARQLCEQLNWIGPSGRVQLTMGRQALAHLEQAGLIPASQGRPVGAARPRAPSDELSQKSELTQVEPIECDLEELGPVELILVTSRYSQHYRIWKQLLERYHYRGAGRLCGAQLRYLLKSKRGWIGAMAFSAAARRVDSRDRWIGWSEVARRENLHRVVNQSRFLIAQSVKVAYLASHVLGLVAGRIQRDWRERHGYEPLLLESFVEREHFQGTSYRAANWQVVGVTAGRGRQDRQHEAQAGRKLVLVYPLDKRFREKLCVEPEQRRLFHRSPALPPPPPPPQDWAEEELGASALAGQRLRRRAMELARDFFARPQANVPQACGSRAKTKAAYRFFDHPKVSMQTILKGHYQASMRRARQYPVVLAVQDTTDLNYSAHPQTEQLGPIADGKHGQVGLLVHDTMLYNLEGTPLGLLDVQCWVRGEEEMGQDRRDLPIEQKESYKWLQSFRAASALQGQCPQSQIVSMGDREADLYELFIAAREDPHQTKFLVRVCQDRRLAGAEKQFLWERILGQAVVASMKLKVPRKKKQPARTAIVEVRYQAVEVPAPSRKRELGPVKLWAVSVLEKNAPEGVEPVEWMLLTNLPVESPEAALEKIQWYCLRFQIEVYHRTLKSGCKIEERQLGSAERIESCLGIDLLVAWRIVHLTKLGRETPEVPCTVFFEEAQWQAVLLFITRQPPPKEPPTLRAMILMVAQLGGFLGRKSDGQPGAKSMWLGLQRMDDLAEMWRAIKSMDPASLWALLDSS